MQLLAGLALLARGTVGAATDARPNVVLISIDTLRRDALRAFNPHAPPLPRLDRLAAGARRFTRAYSTASWTLPAHASALTGLLPSTHGAVHPASVIAPPGPPPLAVVLQAHGYATFAFTDGGFVDQRYGFARGFDRYDTLTAPGAPPLALPRDGGGQLFIAVDPFDRGRALLAQRRPGDAPFFLFLHTYLLHHYWVPRVCQPDLHQSQLGAPFDDGVHSLCLNDEVPCSAREWAALRALYDSDLAYLDGEVGQLLTALDAAGSGRATVVVLMSDHGEGFDPARHRVHHSGRLHEDQLRIPLFVAGPGVEAADVGDTFSLADLMPTLLAHLALPLPDGLDGRAYPLHGVAQPSSTAAAAAAESAFYWTSSGRQGLPTPPAAPLQRAVMRGDLWYIDGTDGEELYDMAADPEQRHNLAPGNAALPALRAALNGATAPPTPAPAPTLDATTRDRLRQLGY